MVVWQIPLILDGRIASHSLMATETSHTASLSVLFTLSHQNSKQAQAKKESFFNKNATCLAEEVHHMPCLVIQA